ncbi:hypothetical protein A359_07280 [secondary endosymbiont of Ctenarytaina eucalypti]|uniref:Uncharacterized protein n=1 Tax=secondary endosymbiont of Ctenarytaina eucalypti TaxID=1199245 RepID=J3VT12_9ENTR|nr:hypothetical protein A359_07280 [secondary endosymbiont of Ctenarytaina eucalypti]
MFVCESIRVVFFQGWASKMRLLITKVSDLFEMT